jgi:hypothetical protein
VCLTRQIVASGPISRWIASFGRRSAVVDLVEVPMARRRVLNASMRNGWRRGLRQP